jgi:hypothetical protein
MKNESASRWKPTLEVVLCAAALSSLVQGSAASATSWNVSCCTVFESMTKFTVERTGSYLQADTCRASETKCMDLKLIHEFVEQSRVSMMFRCRLARDTRSALSQFAVDMRVLL